MRPPTETTPVDTPLIETRGLYKHYGRTAALEDINLALPAGEIIGLVGKNGAGKTTLLALLAGAMRAGRGSIKVLGQPPAATTLRGQVGVLLQDTRFKPGLAVVRQLIQFARLQGNSRRQAERMVDALLGQIGAIAYAQRQPEALSLGQYKRLAIAQAFLGAPALIILDEPTAGLDPVSAADMRQFIRRFIHDQADNSAHDKAIGGSVIISSHNLHEIEDICRRVVILDDGRLLANATLEELCNRDKALYFTTERPLPAAALAAIGALAGVVQLRQDEDEPARIACEYQTATADSVQLAIQQIIVRHGIGIISMRRGVSAAAHILQRVSQAGENGQ